MAKKEMKKALGASLKAESEAVKARFERAETALARPVKSSEALKSEAAKEERVIRDSFTIPADEYAQIAALKQRVLRRGVAATKSEVLRAGLAALREMDDKTLLEALSDVPKVKTGRPAANSES